MNHRNRQALSIAVAGMLLAGLPSCSEDDNGGPVPDTTPPTVVLTYPDQDEPIRIDEEFTATAEDDGGEVVSVTFLIDDQVLGEDSEAPFTLSGTALIPWADDATHVFTAQATDPSGNIGTSEPISATVVRPETLPLTDVLAIAGPGEHNGHAFGRVVDLDPAITYTANERIEIDVDTCIRGHSAKIALRRSGSFLVVPGEENHPTRCDIEYCFILKGKIPSEATFGGAVEYERGTQGWIVNNTFYDNDPAALYLHWTTPDLSLRVINNIFYANIQGLIRFETQDWVYIRHNNSIANGSERDYGEHCECPDDAFAERIEPDEVHPAGQNISIDPMLVKQPNPPKEPGDFHLKAGSPCIGTGENGEDLGAFPFEG
ncbi:Ig-like domain-containing protein [Candidatus Eisenbacteria bacterium]|uniref:Ig-like domain-containing protein n=1 Tax=Eiseniibacteriota bacterium TaxID=2212470 RepID=A0ABV6YJ97_UNCEI